MIARWAVSMGLVLGLSVAPEISPLVALSQPASPRPCPVVARGARHLGVDGRADGVFVRTLTLFKDRLWVGTFNDGFFVVDAWPASDGLGQAHAVPAPFRMVNDALEVNGALYVAANEGLFVTGDGARFERVREVRARGVTAVAFDGRSLYATTTSALWRLRIEGAGPKDAVWWKPAGSRSLQGVVAERGRVWLASEDRGAILFDGKRFTAYDRLAGLPTSWVVAITGDGQGGAFAATLRDGAMHLDATGRWQPIQGLPSGWTLSILRGEHDVCVGTQDGAACYDSPAAGLADAWSTPSWRIDGLPDPRVHAFLMAHDGLLVGTEGGMAVASRVHPFDTVSGSSAL